MHRPDGQAPRRAIRRAQHLRKRVSVLSPLRVLTPGRLAAGKHLCDNHVPTCRLEDNVALTLQGAVLRLLDVLRHLDDPLGLGNARAASVARRRPQRRRRGVHRENGADSLRAVMVCRRADLEVSEPVDQEDDPLLGRLLENGRGGPQGVLEPCLLREQVRSRLQGPALGTLRVVELHGRGPGHREQWADVLGGELGAEEMPPALSPHRLFGLHQRPQLAQVRTARGRGHKGGAFRLAVRQPGVENVHEELLVVVAEDAPRPAQTRPEGVAAHDQVLRLGRSLQTAGPTSGL
mmetsp:Transcript_101427/g.272505  ORF Transcript_101427/g.272505 Transcript_101427/m.272505 type:complete len:292 (-) Transcript_101427:181-1056(-)